MGKAAHPKSPVFWPLLGLGLLLALDTLINPGFLKVSLISGHVYGVPIDILTQGSRALVLALGMTLVIATGGVDLSVGSVMAVSGTVCALMLQSGKPLALSLAASIGSGIVAGTINGVLVARARIQPIVATLILMVTGRGIAELIAGGQVIRIERPGFDFLANGFVLGLPFAPILVVALYLATHLFLRRTAAGLFIEAVGDNETASRFAGLSAAWTKILAYVFCGACAGFAGILSAANIKAADPYRAGENMELDAIFAVVVGGTALTGGRFLLSGSLVGTLLLQAFTSTLYFLGVAPAIAPVPKALLIIGVALLQSSRLRGWLGNLVPRKERG